VQLGLRQPDSGMARSVEEAARAAAKIGYPVMVRPSYVLGGRAMQIVFHEPGLLDYMASAVKASPNHPVLIDKYLEDAIEIDVDAISDGRQVVVAGIMEHIEEAGVHSGDSACSLPPYTLEGDMVAEIRRQTAALAMELGVVGLMNAQFAVRGGHLYVLEVPEMKSTGEVMGIDDDFGWAFAKSQAAAGVPLPRAGRVVLSVKDHDKPAALEVARRLRRLGFLLEATRGTAAYLQHHGVE